MPRWTKRPDDPVLADLYLLANKTAVLPAQVARCSALLSLLPERLIRPEASDDDKAISLKQVMVEILDAAYESRCLDDEDALAGMVLAAGAVMGLVTEWPYAPIKRKPSQMETKASTSSKQTRQEIAASWLNPPVGWDQFRRKGKNGEPSKEHQSLVTFRAALLSKLGVHTVQRYAPLSTSSHQDDPVAEASTADGLLGSPTLIDPGSGESDDSITRNPATRASTRDNPGLFGLRKKALIRSESYA